MRSLLKATVAAVLVTVIQACASVSQRTSVETVDIADGIMLALPGPAELLDSMTATQLISATYAEQTYQMQAHLEWRPGAIALACMNAFGTVLFSIEYDGEQLESRGSPMLTQQLRPEYVLADLLLTFWDIDRLRTKLRGAGLELSEEGGRRVIARDGAPVIVINYAGTARWNGSVRFDHVERGYVLDIQTLGVAAT